MFFYFLLLNFIINLNLGFIFLNEEFLNAVTICFSFYIFYDNLHGETFVTFVNSLFFVFVIFSVLFNANLHVIFLFFGYFYNHILNKVNKIILKNYLVLSIILDLIFDNLFSSLFINNFSSTLLFSLLITFFNRILIESVNNNYIRNSKK